MKKFEEELKRIIFNGVNKNNENFYLTSNLIKNFKDWVSPEDHQAEIGKIELQNLKYREEIARMQKSLRKKNKAIKELNGAVKKSKARLKECEKLRIEANNEVAMEFSRKCEVVEERAELKCENAELKSQLEKQQPEIPEVPQFVAEWLDRKPLYAINSFIPVEIIEWSKKQTGYADLGMNISHLLKLKVNGYTAKEKRYEVVFLEDDTTRQILMENNAGYYFIEEESENYGYWKQDFTEMKIKEINEKFWQLSVPVENERIEVQE